MEQEEYRIPPRVLLNSFGLIFVVYVGVIISQTVCSYLVSLLFPDYDVFHAPKGNEQVGLMAPFGAPPAIFFWLSLALTSLCCLAIGALVVRSARFSPMGHTVLAAALVAITYLQTSFDAPSHLKWVALVAMVLFPSAILLGGHLFSWRPEEQPESASGADQEDESAA